ncbi:MAG: hypothetical protein GKR88_12835 [Flavobacteriaceae bacterium]|nr:MAG: hypothetical protein GKR88_12835 [Flavobacteriaceae bacterium]
MKTKLTILLCSILISVTASSCGVIFGGSKYNATIIAKNHPNADIYVNGEKTGKGTATGTYHRNRPLEVKVKDGNCKEYTKTYHKIFRTGNFILSVISWGIIGIGVDLGTGAAYKPDHRGEPSITKVNDKNYTFTVEPECN